MIDNRYTYETPESVAIGFAPAGPVIRGVAYLRDWLVKILFYILFALLASRFEAVGGGMWLLFTFFMEWFYPVVFEVLNNGMTPAKQWMGIRVIRADGTPVGWSDSMIRNLLRVVDALPFGYGFGLVAMLCNRRFQRIGDLVANTLVIYNPPKHTPNALPAAAPLAASTLAVALSREEQQAFISLAERHALLSEPRQQELAAIVAPLLHASDEAALPQARGLARDLAGES